jgi:LEA14-like dessication related protein
MPRLASLALLFSLACLAVGCGSMVKQPTASFRGQKLREATAEGFRVDFDVDVDNPNGFALPVSGAKYKLGLGGVTVVDEAAKPTGSVPARGALPVTIPVALSFEKLLSAEKSISGSGGNVPYDFDGQIEFTAGPLAALGQSIKVPVKFSGTLPLGDIVREAAKDPVAFARSPAAQQILRLVGGKDFLGKIFGK